MTDAVLKAGRLIDERFELVKRLGSGAIGAVWLAKDLQLGQDVALKLLHPKLVHDIHAIGQLEREAEVLGQLRHPNIAAMYTFSSKLPNVYLAIEFVDGHPLQEVIGQHTKGNQFFRHGEVRRLFKELCSAVSHAHSKMIVHRDLKPHNIMIVQQGPDMHTKVLDFGIARLLEGSIFDATTFGRQLGSLFYMSPEQTRGEPADERSDVFGLGAILFELLTLHRTWARDDEGKPLPAFAAPIAHGEANSIAAVFTRIATAERPRPSVVRPALGRDLDDILERALATDPADRFPTVRALAKAADEALEGLAKTAELRTEMLGGVLKAPEAVYDDSETRIEPAATTELMDAPKDLEFGDLTEAEPTDRKKRSIPETRPYQGARPGVPLEEAGPTIRAAGPLTVPAEPKVVIHGRSTPPPTALAVEKPADGTEVDARSVDGPGETEVDARTNDGDARERAEDTRSMEQPAGDLSDEREGAMYPPTAEVEGSSLKLPLLTVTFILAVALATTLTVLLTNDVPVAKPITIEAPPPPPPPQEGVERYDFGPLNRHLNALKSNPNDVAALEGLKREIHRAAAEVADPEERRQIEKIAELSSLVRNVEGLESAVERLKAALAASP